MHNRQHDDANETKTQRAVPGTKVNVILTPVPEVGIIRVRRCRTYLRGHRPSAGSARLAGGGCGSGAQRWSSPSWRLARLSQRAGHDFVTTPAYPGRMDHHDHYADAIRAEPGVCWRMVSRGLGYRVGTPTDCPEPVKWTGEPSWADVGCGSGHASGTSRASMMSTRWEPASALPTRWPVCPATALRGGQVPHIRFRDDHPK